MTAKNKPAILGGEPAVSIPFDPNLNKEWKELKEAETEDTLAAVGHLIKEGISSILDGGGVIGEFEKNFSAYIGRRFALAQNTGTSTIHAALYAVGVGPGDEVIVPSYTWYASATPILACRGIPVFCEIDPKTLCLDPDDLQRRITPRTKAIIVVHLWGHPCDMDRINEIARRHNIAVIEDASHAHGGSYKGRKIGALSDVACFSLQGSKPLAAGEGGVFLTDNPTYYDRALALGHFGRPASFSQTGFYRPFARSGMGFKYRPHPFGIAMANVQLKYLDVKNRIRHEHLNYLTECLEGLPGIEPMYTAPYADRGGWYGYRIQYHEEELGLPKERFMEALRAEGVPVFPERYEMLHLLPVFNPDTDLFGKNCPYHCPHAEHRYKWSHGSLPITESTYARLIGLPENVVQKDLIEQWGDAFRKLIDNISSLKDAK